MGVRRHATTDTGEDRRHGFGGVEVSFNSPGSAGVGGHEMLSGGGHETARARPTVLPRGGRVICSC
jgi:hypothetical protein